jgi:hypothetical protein
MKIIKENKKIEIERIPTSYELAAQKLADDNSLTVHKDTLSANLARARSINVGTCFGGMVEINMRNEHNHMWAPISQYEVIELIHSLAANIGCTATVVQRKDFASSLRKWEEDARTK